MTSGLSVVTMQDLLQENIEGFMPILIDIYNPDISWTEEEKQVYKQDNAHFRFICDDNTVVYQGKTYLPCSFEYVPPESDGSKIGNASVSITALDHRVRELLRKIRTTSEFSIVAMFVKINKDPNEKKFVYKYKEIKSAKFKMSVANLNTTTATFNLAFDRALSQSIPYDTATSERVPSTKG